MSPRDLLSPKSLSLTAVCAQSTVLAIVLHLSQDHARFRASSAVLLAELLKLVLSVLLALRDTWTETRGRHHLVPVSSPTLRQKAPTSPLCADDPYARGGALDLGVTLEGDATRLPSSALSGRASASELCEKGAVEDDTPPASLGGQLLADLFRDGWWKMGFPALLFAVQNNLIYVAARNLSVPVFQVTFQLKTLFTALAAVVMLGRRLALIQWVSLVILGLGVATMQLGSISAKKGDVHHHAAVPGVEGASYVAGLTAILVSCMFSAVAATYFELVIKKPVVVDEHACVQRPPSLWIRNIQLSLFSLVFGMLAVVAEANPGQFAFWTDGLEVADALQHWYDPVVRSTSGFFAGFGPSVWVVIVLQSVGGLLIAVAIKHADNISKGFALSVSIVFTFLLSVIIFDFKLTAASVLGGTAVVGSTLLFEMDEQRVLRFITRRDSTDADALKPALFRRWHAYLLVVIVVTVLVAVVPARHYSLSTTAWELVAARDTNSTLHSVHPRAFGR